MSNIITVGLIDAIAFLDKLVTNQFVTVTSDKITFTDLVSAKAPITGKLSDTLLFRDNVVGAGKKLHVSFNDTLLFNQRLFRSSEIFLGDFLTFTQSHERPEQFFDTITFTDNIVYGHSIPVFDTLLFSDIVTANHHYSNIALSDTLIFSDNGVVSQLPTVGRPWDILFVPVQPITRQDFITLSANGVTITLRNPSFGNQYKLQYNVIKKETRGRDLIIAANSTFATKEYVETISYEIDYLKQTDGYNLINFLNNNIGQLITLTDYEGIVWNGVITNPEIGFIQKDRANFSVGFELEYVSF
jgi:hypothetical protein